MLRRGQHGQHGSPVAVIAHARSSAEEAFAVLPQNLTIAIRIHAAQRGGRGLAWSDSAKLHFSCQATRRDAPAVLARLLPEARDRRMGPSGMPPMDTNLINRCVSATPSPLLITLELTLLRYPHHEPRMPSVPTIGYIPQFKTDFPWGRCASAGFVHWHKADRSERLFFAAVHKSGNVTDFGCRPYTDLDAGATGPAFESRYNCRPHSMEL